MKTLLEWRGIITVLNTPFTERDTIDLPGLSRNVEGAITDGVAGFLVPAMASEVEKLTEAERETLVRAVLDTAGGRVPVIGGASAADALTRLRAAERLVELGCAGVLVSIPFEDAAQYARDVRAVAGVSPPLLMLQDWDVRGDGVPVEVITRLFEEVACFRALKVEVAHAGPKYSALIEATGGRLHVSGGWAVMQMIEALDRGVHAFMPTGLHRIYTRLYGLYTSGARDEARALFYRLLPVIAFSNQNLDVSIQFFKGLLHQQGVYATARVREPIQPLDAVQKRVADELIEYALRLLLATV